jgi:methylenetetrahydrofolate reductase (NADPH)
VRIAELYAGQRPVFSLEFYTPRTEAGNRALWRTLSELKTLEPGYVSVTCGAAGTTRGPTAEAVIRIQTDFGLMAMPHMVCTGTTSDQLLETLERLEARGVENVLALRGDPPRDQPEWRPVPGGFRHANELAAFIRERFDFCLGGACYPEKHHEAPSLEEDLRHLREKVDAGVEFLITQVFFDDAVYWRFVERVRDLGIHVPIVPGIMPLRDLASLERIVTLSPGTSVPAELRERLGAAQGDEERSLAEGAAWAARQVRALLDGGAPGIHYYTLNLSPSTLRAHALVTRR